MPSNNGSGRLGRENIWPDQPKIWEDIDKALSDTIGPIRVAAKVFHTDTMWGAPNVTDNQALPAPGAAGMFVVPEGPPVLFMEISTQFLLTQNQVDNEPTLHSAIDAVRDAARRLALAEDLLIFNGQTVALPAGVTVTNLGSARNGLLGAATRYQTVPLSAGPPAPARAAAPRATPRWDTYTTVMTSLSADLYATSHPGPFALVLAPVPHGDTTSPFAPAAPITVMDRLNPEFTSGIYSAFALDGAGPAAIIGGRAVTHRGLLVSCAGNLTTLTMAQDAVVQYIPDTTGNHIFRVVERVQFVARDGLALVRLEFT